MKGKLWNLLSVLVNGKSDVIADLPWAQRGPKSPCPHPNQNFGDAILRYHMIILQYYLFYDALILFMMQAQWIHASHVFYTSIIRVRMRTCTCTQAHARTHTHYTQAWVWRLNTMEAVCWSLLPLGCPQVFALDYSHRQGIANRDIKLENALLEVRLLELPARILFSTYASFGMTVSRGRKECLMDIQKMWRWCYCCCCCCCYCCCLFCEKMLP